MEFSEVQMAALAEILGGKTPAAKVSDMDGAGHGPAISELISMGMVEIWEEVECRDKKSIERWGGSVTLTPYGAWTVECELSEFIEAAPIWVRVGHDSVGRRVTIDRPMRVQRHPRMEFRDWRTLCDVADSAHGTDYLDDEEGHPVLFRGKPIPIDRRMGRKQAPKIRRSKKS